MKKPWNGTMKAFVYWKKRHPPSRVRKKLTRLRAFTQALLVVTLGRNAYGTARTLHTKRLKVPLSAAQYSKKHASRATRLTQATRPRARLRNAKRVVAPIIWLTTCTLANRKKQSNRETKEKAGSHPSTVLFPRKT